MTRPLKKKTKKLRKVKEANVVPLKLDFGCGPNKREGFQGVDKTAFVGVDVVLDVTKDKWPWEDNSVTEAHASHFIERLTKEQRSAFMNELYRVLIPNGTCTIIVPSWSSNRAYGDPTHEWPPVVPMWFYYLSRNWRESQAPHTDKKANPLGLDCDFEATWGACSVNPDILVKNQEAQQFASQHYVEVVLDLMGTLKALK